MRIINVTILAAILFASACAGIKARESVLIPAMQVAWLNVSKDIERGIDQALEMNDIDAIQAAGLRSQIIAMDVALEGIDAMRVADVNWRRLNQIAKIGIDYFNAVNALARC